MTDHIRYDLLAQQALRGMIRQVLIDAAKSGLPGDHHFFISFDTRARGVKLSPRLLAQHPEEMTVVLQHQFWDLQVTEEGFEVGLSFGGIPERLGVPFEAIKGFFDPSVQFQLQFEVAPARAPASAEAEKKQPLAPVAQSAKPRRVPRTPAKPAAARPQAEPSAPSKPPDSDETADKPTPSAGGAEVVSLDRFRKK
jgi:hypothetical protein